MTTSQVLYSDVLIDEFDWQSMPRQPALFYQQIASDWLHYVRASIDRAAVRHPVIGKSQIDLLEVLRTELLVLLGKELSAFHGQALCSPMASKTTQAANSARASWLHAMWSKLHNQAYLAKRNVLRQLEMLSSGGGKISDRIDVLVVARTQSHASDALPIARRLRDDFGITSAFAVADRRIGNGAREAGFRVSGLYFRPDRVGKNQIDLGLKHLTQLCQRLESLFGKGAKQASHLSEHMLRGMQKLLHVRAANIFAQAHGFYCLSNLYCPQLILIGNPYTAEGKLAACVARDCGIASAAIEHGTVCENDPRWQGCSLDLACVWGEPSRRALESNGIPRERIAVTGSPRHDPIFLAAEERAATRGALEPTILVATSGAGDQVALPEHQRFIALLTEAIGQLPEVRWVIKLHPKDRPDYYGALTKLDPRRVQIVESRADREGADIFDYLKPSRALVTVTSSTALDAMSVGVPVISVNVWQSGQRPQGIAFLKRACTREAANADELIAQVRASWNGQANAATDAAARQYVSEQFANQGAAVQAVTKELAKLVARLARSQQGSESAACKISGSI